MKPILVYDGDCGFCKKWIDRWNEITQDAVDYAPYQSIQNQFPQISLKEFQSAVQLVEPNGAISSGAEAVFRTLSYSKRHRWLLEFYLKFPSVKPIADVFYKLVATHRSFFSKLTKWFWGESIQTPSFTLSKIIFIRFLAVIYLIAFLSFATQVIGLIGKDGILPVEGTLQTVKSQLGLSRYWWFPTLCWLNSTDWFLYLICGAGALLSVALFFLVTPTATLFLLWILYLSIVTTGREFMSFQWDVLLLETGFLAIFIQSSKWARIALKWLLFRLMFSSGMVKLASGDLAWRNLTALSFHYETQPLPPWTAWHMHQLPLWFHQLSTVMMFAIELILPFLLFFPRKLRHFAAFGIIFLMAVVVVTGNYCFFNWLTIALAILIIDDSLWHRWFRKSVEVSESKAQNRNFWNRFVATPICVFLILLSLVPMARLTFRARMPEVLMKVYALVNPFNLVNHYGLFAVMTKERPEIIIEGSEDGQNWKAYEFKYKIGDVIRRPKFVAPHQPRLDWQMWFAALGTYRENPWLVNLCIRLLEGELKVLRLIEANPFPEKPPIFIRAVLYQYHFSDEPLKRESGVWWRRDYKGIYLPELSLKR